MTILSNLRSGFTNAFGRADAPHATPTPAGGNTWQTIGGNSIPMHDTYDNVFPYVNAIAQRFSTVIPYAVTSDGRRLNPAPPAIRALYAPNDTYSCLEFLKLIASGILTQSHVDILIWTTEGPGGNITPDNITGYTLLPANSRVYNDTRSDWYHRVTMDLGDGVRQYEFTRNETIALSYSRHPDDPTRGISPAMTIKKWANVDDMIADYERGFFGNNAVPAGMLGIVSENAEDFQRNRARLEETFRGAGNNNGIAYNMIPVDPLTHKPSQTSKLVWVPFQNSNDSLDLQTVNDVVNNRLANALAVPDIIRGIDNGQTYANAEMAERSFIENTLKPLCMTVWDKWQFELDRVTGGLGYGVTFTLDLPAQTEVEKIQAETQQIRINNLLQLVNMGASVETAVEALNLPEAYRRLDLHPSTHDTPLLPSARNTTKASKPINGTPPESHLLTATRTYVNRVIQLTRRSQAGLRDDLGIIGKQWVNDVENDLIAHLTEYARKTGVKLEQVITAWAELHPGNPVAVEVQGYTQNDWQKLYNWAKLPTNVKTAYLDHLETIANMSSKTITAKTIDLLTRADTNQWDARRLNDELTHLGNEHAELIARCETVQAQRLGSLYSARNMSETLGVRLQKVWRTSGDTTTCDFCKHMGGVTIGLDGSYLDYGASVETGDRTYVNSFENMITPNGHPNCRCYEDYEVGEN
ncbi:MAG: portal protein [Namikivirus tsukuho]|uniref:Portal protein n=1 Tax=Bacteriophage sp. TaxID=38018 RepID=A0ABY5TTF0_9VIRU|nr:MAG: portal protein [Bacteriophage sp.]